MLRVSCNSLFLPQEEWTDQICLCYLGNDYIRQKRKWIVAIYSNVTVVELCLKGLRSIKMIETLQFCEQFEEKVTGSLVFQTF